MVQIHLHAIRMTEPIHHFRQQNNLMPPYR